MTTTRWPLAGAWMTIGVAAAMLSPRIALAQQCEGEQAGDCPAGYVCDSYEAGFCTAEACSPDGECPEPVCESVEYFSCAPAPCEADADCPDDMVCNAQIEYECDDYAEPDCEPGMDCEPWEPPVCTETEVHQCLPRYLAPCTESSDCGEGFDCLEDSYWVCDAGMAVPDDTEPTDGVDPEAGDEPVEADEGSCYEEASGYFSCHLQELPCDTDDDCPGSLRCVDQPSSWSCSGTGSTPSGGPTDAGEAGAGGEGDAMPPPPVEETDPAAEGDAAIGDGDGDVGGEDDGWECTETPPAIPRLCMPDDYYYPGPIPGGDPTSGGGGDTQAPPTEPGEGDSTDGGFGNGPGDEDGDGDGNADDDAEADEDGHGHGHGHGRKHGLGQLIRHVCSVGEVGTGGHGGALAWLAPLALVGLGLRRRRQR